MPKQYYKVVMHYDNLERYSKLNNDEFRKAIYELFMNGRGEVCDIFNAKIDDVNKCWNETGKPCSLGDYVEDINPEYAKFIQNAMKDDIDNYNRTHELVNQMNFFLDDVCDIAARLWLFPDVKIWITLKDLNEEEA